MHFRIDNTSTIAWQFKMDPRYCRVHILIRMLGYREHKFDLRFSSSHVAGAGNVRADIGSRLVDPSVQSAQFDLLTSTWSQDMIDGGRQLFATTWQPIFTLIRMQVPRLPSSKQHFSIGASGVANASSTTSSPVTTQLSRLK